jgi:hypothetical protein
VSIDCVGPHNEDQPAIDYIERPYEDDFYDPYYDLDIDDED